MSRHSFPLINIERRHGLVLIAPGGRSRQSLFFFPPSRSSHAYISSKKTSQARRSPANHGSSKQRLGLEERERRCTTGAPKFSRTTQARITSLLVENEAPKNSLETPQLRPVPPRKEEKRRARRAFVPCLSPATAHYASFASSFRDSLEA